MSLLPWLEWYGIVLTTVGLFADLVGVFVLLSVESKSANSVVETIFSFNKAEQIDELRDSINQQRLQLRGIESFNENDFCTFENTNEKLLESIINRNAPDLGKIAQVGFIARGDYQTRSSSDIYLHVKTVTQNGDEYDIPKDEINRWLEDAKDSVRYRQGGWSVLIGFSVWLVAQLLVIIRFCLVNL